MTNRKGRRRLAPLAFLLILFPALARLATAQTYKAGDKIDVLAGSGEINGKYVGGHWVPGTIVRVTQTTRQLMYLVNNDGEQPNQDAWYAGLPVPPRARR